MTVTYKPGNYLVITSDDTEIQFEILECTTGTIRLRDSLTRIKSSRKVKEIDELLVLGKAVIHQKSEQTRKLLKSNAIEFGNYPEDLKREARDRYIFVTTILELSLPSHSEQRLLNPIKEVWEDEDNEFEYLKKQPSARSVQRWIDLYIEGDESIRALISKRANKGNRKPKVDEVIEPYILLAIDYFKSPVQPSVASAYSDLKTRINFDNQKIEDRSLKMKVPAKTAFLKRLEKEAPKELLIARKGKESARKEFRTAKLPQDISLILQRVESDHTQLDLFIIDEESNLILGRPYVTALLDYKSKCVLGFYIGFEKPSYLSIARALRHAILPKSYVKERYPTVENSYDCYGLPKVLVVDRGKDFESIALKDACMDLNIRIQRNPAKHPWYKGSVESFFKTKNKQLLDDKSGKVFSNIVDTNEYNPQKHAIITMGLFMEIFHIWLIDYYHQSKVSRGTIIPNVSWKEDAVQVPFRTINEDALNIVLAETKRLTNNKGGIGFEYIKYDSDELFDLRAETGFKKVTFKYDREDLGEIYVLDERNSQDKKYITVPALNQKYARGLTLHQHKTILAFNRKYLDGKTDEEALARAKMTISNLIQEHIASMKKGKVGTSQNIGRYEDVGQQKDNSVKSTAVNKNSNYNGLPKPDEQQKQDRKTEQASSYDGKHNTLPDDLEF